MEEEKANEAPESKTETVQPSSKTLREEISDLKAKLNEIGQKKEEWFKKKEDLKQEIARLITNIKEARASKEQFGTKIKELKENRDKHNKEVQELVAKIKALPQKPEHVDRPEFIKSQIEKLETALETQAFDFEKEKKVMKQINALKKKYDIAKESFSAKGNVKELSRQIEDAKKKADDFHAQLRDCLKEHRESQFGKLSKEINHVKKVQEEAFANFIKHKQEFAVINKALKEKLEQSKGEQEKREIVREDKRREKKDIESQQIKKKAKEVKERFKAKKFLTTEDLIALQAEPEDSEDF